jgi:TRAP-type C4-dicarboxylate transport system permease small subunit
MEFLKLLSKIITTTYRIVVIAITTFLFVIVAYNVIRRYVFNNSIAWADELARFSFIWVNLLGIIYVFQNDELIKLDIVSALICKIPGGKIVLDILEFLIISFILAILAYYSIKFVSVMHHVSATLAMPMKVVYSVLPFSICSMFIGNIYKLIIKINRKKRTI